MSYTPQEKRLTITALLVVFLLGAMDNVIVSTALPRIIEQLHGLELYSWVGTIYMLSSTIMVPIYGSLSDLYGRKPILIAGVSIFLFGSALCGLAGEFGPLPVVGGGMMQLIIARAIQGIGGGALFSSAFSIIADLYPPRERGRYMGLFGGMFGVASILGPAIGGFFTDLGATHILGHEVAGWRWIFYVNLPLGLVALGMVIYRMPFLRPKATARADYLGAALVVTTCVPLLLALTWGGREYAWDSSRVLSLLVTSLVSMVLFVLVERRIRNGILPLHLFRIRAFALTNAASFVVGMAFFGVIMYIPLFMQAVQGLSATHSGFAMLPFMAGMLLSATGSGNLVSRLGRYRVILLSGCAAMFFGVFFLHDIGPETTTFDLGWRLFLVGFGMGPSQSIFPLVSQTAVGRDHLGVATSSIQFFRQIGATIGIALFGTLLIHQLNVQLTRHVPSAPGVVATQVDLGEAQARVMNPHELGERIRQAYESKWPDIEQALQGDAAAMARVQSDLQIPADLRARIAQGPGNTHNTSSAEALHQQLLDHVTELEHQVSAGTRQAFAGAIVSLFWASLWVVCAAIALMVCIPEMPLSDERRGGRPAADAPVH